VHGSGVTTIHVFRHRSEMSEQQLELFVVTLHFVLGNGTANPPVDEHSPNEFPKRTDLTLGWKPNQKSFALR